MEIFSCSFQIFFLDIGYVVFWIMIIKIIVENYDLVELRYKFIGWIFYILLVIELKLDWF